MSQSFEIYANVLTPDFDELGLMTTVATWNITDSLTDLARRSSRTVLEAHGIPADDIKKAIIFTDGMHAQPQFLSKLGITNPSGKAFSHILTYALPNVTLVLAAAHIIEDVAPPVNDAPPLVVSDQTAFRSMIQDMTREELQKMILSLEKGGWLSSMVMNQALQQYRNR